MVAPRNTIYAEESAEVEVLYANLDKLKLLTKKIQGSVQRLDHSGEVIEHAIGPIYSNTQSLQTTSDNVNRLQEAILRLREPLNVKGEEEAAIRAGPQAIGIQEYLTAMRRLEKALADLTATKLRANQKAASEFGFLLATGSSKLQEVFRSILLETITPIEPLHYSTKHKKFPLVPSEKITELTSICEAITSASRYKVEKVGKSDVNPAVRIYAEIRGAYITNSLSNLATASINTAKRRPSDGPYKQGTNGIGMYATCMEAMIFAEDASISHIFPISQRGKALEATCHGVLDDLQKTLRELNIYIKGNLMTDCFLGFEILEIISTLAYKVSGQTGQLKHQFLDVLRPIRDTCKASLSEILDQTRQKSSAINVLPTDGAPVPLVSEIMTIVVALAGYSKPLAGILGSIGDGNWKSNSNAPSQLDSQQQAAQKNTDSSVLLSHYILDMLEAMLSTLDSRARSFHRSKLILGAFLANTICIVDRAIKNNPDLARYAGSGVISARLDVYRKRGLSTYLEAWRDPSSHLLDVQHTSRAGTGSTTNFARPTSSLTSESTQSLVKVLSSKDRDTIKDKFKGFNTSFEEIIQRHRGLCLEPEVRMQFAKEVQSFVEPLYSRFFDRYAEIDRGRGKYVKFDKTGLAGQLSSAFASTIGPGTSSLARPN
ncbi:hypothetical protein KEM56_005017 [Ascosphaera pollenicola]|nr:hypothetical protein KEM56_005017 [Ascosphaera pollenicola]